MIFSEDFLAPLFQAVGDALRLSRDELNAADIYNANHGDHMVEVFETAARAASERTDANPAAVDWIAQMQQATLGLRGLTDNGSAQMYANGLEAIADQLRKNEISADEFLALIRKSLAADSPETAPVDGTGLRHGVTLKALLSGLANWGEMESGRPMKDNPLTMNTLFELGVAYVQAKARSGSRTEILADAAASASPLSAQPHRYQSGKLALQALLEAIRV